MTDHSNAAFETERINKDDNNCKQYGAQMFYTYTTNLIRVFPEIISIDRAYILDKTTFIKWSKD